MGGRNLDYARPCVILNNMNNEEFEETLRRFLRHKPFFPFVVELVDGRLIEIDSPKLVFGGGGASFFTPNYELVEFECEEVRAIRSAVPEAVP